MISHFCTCFLHYEIENTANFKKNYAQLKEFTNHKTNTMVSTFNYIAINCNQMVDTRTSIYLNCL